MLDFSKFSNGSPGGVIIEPRKIFSTLNRGSRFRRPSDEQAEVLDAWFVARDRPDVTIKMNTGSGKTLVGLLALQSCLNENKGPAVYVAPDKHLVAQVVGEAHSLGITVTESESDSAFRSGRAILVTNVYKLFNGKSVFGVGNDGVKIPIGSIVIDDAHACLATVAEKFMLRLNSDHAVYKALFAMFRESLKAQSTASVVEIEACDSNSFLTVPYWSWKDKETEVTKLLYEYHSKGDKDVGFAWPLLRDVLPLCQCVFGGGALEIGTRCLAVDRIPTFRAAKRRIYMTATLADDGILVTHFKADADSVALPIKPRGAGAIGDRMILVPQEINPKITQEDLRTLAVELGQTYNVSVIVPSKRRAEFWYGAANQTLDASNISAGVTRLRQEHVGVTVFINKYDGIDLPEDACRVLILDGVPEAYGLLERVEMSVLDGTELQLLRQVQRIEQGMGRGVRTSEDHCVVLLMGAKLTDYVHHPAARSKFTPATQAQLDLGLEVTAQVQNKTIQEIRTLLDYCLQKNPQWLTMSRTRVVSAPEGPNSFIGSSVQRLRKAFDSACNERYSSACDDVQEAINATEDKALKGYLKQQLAEYMHHVDQAKSQEILLSANELNQRVLKPLKGIHYTRLQALKENQAAAAVNYMTQFRDANSLVIAVNSLLEDLSWDPSRTKAFEEAMRKVGALLGFGSQRPEIEINKGPDNLWAVGGPNFFVIECKSGATTDVIAKSDCTQLDGAMTWFANAYGPTCTGVPIMVHRVNRFDRYSAPQHGFRIINEDKLNEFKRNLHAYTATISSADSMRNVPAIATQLTHHRLTSAQFVQAFTTGFTTER